MYFLNNIRAGSIIILIVIFAVVFPAEISPQALEQTTSKGLRMSLIKNSSLMFIHAEVVIYYSEIKNPTIPYLTFMNIFNDQVKDPQTGLLNLLFKMGNDVEFDYRTDYLIIKINFLPSDTNRFISFLKGLYSYKDFPLRKFGYSTKNFWKLFTSKEGWRQIISVQIAFSKFFNPLKTGKLLSYGKDLKRLNLSQIRSFYKNNYRLSNSYLSVVGDIKPYVFFGLIEKSFRNFRNRTPNYNKFRYGRHQTDRKVIIVDDSSIRTPVMYWIDPIEPSNNMNHHHSRIVNNILFGYPLGRISRSASSSGIKNFNITWVIHQHRNLSTVCRKIRIGYKDIEKFIYIADNIINNLGISRVSRKEYLDSYNFVFQQEKIDSDKFEVKAEEKISESYLIDPAKNNGPGEKKLLKNLSYANFSRTLSDPSGNYNINRNKKKGIIVIFGKASIIKRFLKNIKPEVLTIR